MEYKSSGTTHQDIAKHLSFRVFHNETHPGALCIGSTIFCVDARRVVYEYASGMFRGRAISIKKTPLELGTLLEDLVLPVSLRHQRQS